MFGVGLLADKYGKRVGNIVGKHKEYRSNQHRDHPGMEGGTREGEGSQLSICRQTYAVISACLRSHGSAMGGVCNVGGARKYDVIVVWLSLPHARSQPQNIVLLKVQLCNSSSQQEIRPPSVL